MRKIDIKNYEGLYQITDAGDVIIVKSGKIKMQHKDKHGYLRVGLSKFGKKTFFFAHRLVALNFIGNPFSKDQVNHVNGIKDDNRLENLEWVTNKENLRHAHDTGLARSPKGEVNHFSKLNKEAVLKIRKKGKYDTYSNMARDYGVSINCVLSIVKRITWKHI